MGLFDKAKEIQKRKQEQREELAKARGPLLAITIADYVGGYGDHRKATGTLVFYEKRVEFLVPMNGAASFHLPASEVSDVAVEGKDEVSRRVTVTRLLAVGIFAFALKKKSADKEAFITIVLADGQEAVFHINKKSPMEMKAALSKVTAQVKQKAPKATAASTADELAKLAKLKDSSVITQAEFENQKARLLS
jgi:hypothetical protein